MNRRSFLTRASTAAAGALGVLAARLAQRG